MSDNNNYIYTTEFVQRSDKFRLRTRHSKAHNSSKTHSGGDSV